MVYELEATYAIVIFWYFFMVPAPIEQPFGFFFESSVDIILGDFLIPKSPFSRAGHAGWPNVPCEPEKTVPGTNEGREKEGGWEARMRKPGMGDKVGADQVVGGRLGEALDGLSC